MAGAGPASNDVWHHSLEDLLQAIETAEATTSGSFVINLQSGAAPLDPPAKGFPRFERLRIYQLARTDQGSPRFQLRLGIIQSDLEADAILASVRKHYPSATKEKVAQADRQALSSPPPPVPPVPATPMASPSLVAVATRKPAAAAPSAKPRAVPTVTPPKPPRVDELQWKLDELLPSLTRSSLPPRQQPPRQQPEQQPPQQQLPRPPPPRQPPQSARPVEVARLPHAAPAREVPRSSTDSDSLRSVVDRIGTLIDAVEAHEERTTAAQPPPLLAPARISPQPPPPVAPRAAPQPAPAARSATAPQSQAPPTPPSPPRPLDGVPEIDSTRTVRALSVMELLDTAASCWYAIQLMGSDAQIDAEQVPNLDIFTEYRLYSVVQPREDGVRHALRVGFFSSEVAAQAVAGYLSAYFPNPTTTRISVAEHERFAEKLVVARKDVGAAGTHAVIEFAAPPSLPDVSVEPVSDGPKSSGQESAGPSLWSRLKGLRAQG